ncbi:MAG: hypothetical protein HUU37_00310 [Bdellovibrionales bacterium]|nr:hypothetical protein [Bdellovibrionales bacterium]
MYAARIDLLFESALLLAAVCFSLSLWVFQKAPGSKLNLAYSALTMNIAAWAFAFFVANVLRWRLFEAVHLISTLLIGPLSLWFLKLLLTPEGIFYRALLWASAVAVAILAPLVVLGLDRYGLIRDFSYYSPSLVLVACVFLLVGELTGGVAPRGAGVWAKILGLPRLTGTDMMLALKKRNLWIYLGGALATLLCGMNRTEWLGRVIPSLGNILLAVYFFLVKDSVTQPFLTSPRRVAVRMVGNLAAAVLLGLVFVMLTVWVRGDRALFLVNVFLAAYVAVIVLDPARSLVMEGLQRLFFQEASWMERKIQDASKEVAGAFQTSAVAAAVERFLSATLPESDLVAFHTLDASGQWYRKVVDRSADQSVPEFLPGLFPLSLRWAREKEWRPLLLSGLEAEAAQAAFGSGAAEAQLAADSLASLRGSLALPVIRGKSLLGFAVVRKRIPGQSWEEDSGILPLMAPFFDRVAEALGEMEMFASLRDRDRLATIGEMAAGLAHEIRNPLGAIKGAAQVIDPKPGDPQEPFLKIIVEETNRLNRVVSQFLDYAKPFRSEHKFCRLADRLAPLVERWRATRAEGVDVTWQAAEDAPEVLCQPELIGQVATNLLDNALQAVREALKQFPERKPRISVRLEHRSMGAGLVDVTLTVEDNGVGMTPEMIDKIFIPFFTASPQGTGLGLSICQKIAEAHGGRMEVDSVPGERTVMRLCFQAERKFV